MPSKGYVDFVEIKQRVSLKQLLSHYKLLPTLSGEGAQRKGPDPFNMATTGKSKPFAVNLDKNVWTLFGGDGRASGNVIDFVMRKECCNVRQAALHLADWFKVGGSESETAAAPAERPQKQTAQAEPPEIGTGRRGGLFNAPLSFELKGLDPHHKTLGPLLFRWGINSSTLEHFGAGLYTGNGKTMKGRLAAPIERDGQCVGYCGIALDPDAEDLFKFPEKWVHGVEMYNLTNAIKAAEEARLRKEAPDILVFRNILQVWQADQLGYPCSVAVLGDELTAEQLRRLFDKSVLQRFSTVLQLHIEEELL